ncbi:MAG: (Fe-S)-binding protein [Chloroflexota bacterium]
MTLFEPFVHVPAYPLVFPVFWGAFAIFLVVLARRIRVFTAVHVDGGPVGTQHLGRRAWGLVRYAILQSKMFRWTRAGIVHYVVFLGSTILLTANINIVTGGLLQAVVGWPFDGAIWTFMTALQNVIAVGVLLTLGYLYYRRLVLRPSRLSLGRTGVLVLTMIFLVVSTEFFAQAFEAAAFGDVDGAIVANALAVPLGAVGHDVASAAFVLLWWGHVASLAVFLLYIPTNKHFHVYTSFVNVWFRKLAPRGELPAMDLEDENATFGLKTLQDLGWKDLLDGFTCTECGRCQEACPAYNTGKPLNPKTFIMGIRDMSESAERTIDLIPNSPIVRETYGLDGTTLAPTALAQPIVDTAIPYDAVWDCVTCGACVEACPVLIEHVDKIVGLRRNLVLEESRFPQELTSAFRAMEGQGNPWGQPGSARLDWTKPLPFEVRTVASVKAAGELDGLEVLYWVGCAAAFDPRNQKVARAVATCLHAAGVSFAVLGQEESCTGDPARRMGNDYVYQILAGGAVETLDRYGMAERTIVTACPHCFNTIGNEYGQLGGDFSVKHHSQYLAELVESGRLATVPEDATSETGDHRPGSVTVHDSCYLARYNGVVAPPRSVLGAAGVSVVEMERSGKQTFCCGAGGGRMWMEETRGTRINAERTRQVLETGAATVATSCPFCMVMMSDGLTAAAQEGAPAVAAMDISEVLAARLASVPEERRLPVV